MNLSKLFDMQRKLDERIVKDKGLEGQDLLDKKILALQTELGEMANELPEEFKFWSNKKNNYEKALKEYVDVLHFILSIGLELELDDRANSLILEFGDESTEIAVMFIEVSSHVNELFWANYHGDDYETTEWRYKSILSNFKHLGEMLGFTWSEIEQAYFDKNAINHERQDNGY